MIDIVDLEADAEATIARRISRSSRRSCEISRAAKDAADFSVDIAQVDGAWASGRNWLLIMRRMSVHFSVDPISAFSLRGAGLSPRRLIRTSSSNGNAAF